MMQASGSVHYVTLSVFFFATLLIVLLSIEGAHRLARAMRKRATQE